MSKISIEGGDPLGSLISPDDASFEEHRARDELLRRELERPVLESRAARAAFDQDWSRLGAHDQRMQELGASLSMLAHR